MSADIKINFSDICPFLIEKGYKTDPLVINPETGTGDGQTCTIGENVVYGEIESDLMLKDPTVQVEVSCKGCKFVPNGFTKIVDSHIKG